MAAAKGWRSPGLRTLGPVLLYLALIALMLNAEDPFRIALACLLLMSEGPVRRAIRAWEPQRAKASR